LTRPPRWDRLPRHGPRGARVFGIHERMMGLEIQVRDRRGVIVLDVQGKITLGNGAEALLAQVTSLLAPDTPRRVIINLAQVPYMDSAAIGALVTCQKRAHEARSSIRLLNPTKRVYDLLHLVKLDSIFESFTDEDLAVDSFGG
jgi:anti-sigma B factor antagonist